MKQENENRLSRQRREPDTSFGIGILVFFMLFFILSSPAIAANWYVKTDGSDTHTGTSWETAFGTIQTAIDAAQKRDEIWVKEGTYALSSTIEVNKGVLLYGGFEGTETERRQRDWQNRVTVIDGQDQVYHCLYVEMPSFHYANARIDGFTITRGNANVTSVSIDGAGGGIYNKQSATTVANCTFTNNRAYGHTRGGGAFFVDGVNGPTILNCYFINNQAIGGTTHGGAIHIASSNPTIGNCLFAGNTAEGLGGALLINGNTPAITNATFTGNQATQGGAIYSDNSAAPTITNSIFWGDAVFANNPLDGPEIYDTSDSPWVTYDFSLVNVDYCVVQDGGTAGQSYFTDGTGNLAQDPLFVNAGAGDLRIAYNSPCVDQGDNAALPVDSADLDGDGDTVEQTPIDIDGHLRVVGAVDMGAYEFRKIWHVAGDVSSVGNGMSWSEAFQTIQEAIDAAQAGHEIWVKAGDYLLDQSIAVNKSVALYGGFDGTERVHQERNWVTHKTTLDGQGSADHCLLISEHATIDGFVITGGVADGPGLDSNGGGIYIGVSGADVSNCIITGNSAVTSGGALYNQGIGTVANSLIYGNDAVNGGGIASENGALTIINATVSQNAAVTGGGIWDYDASSALTNTIVWGNAATTGAALFLSGNSVPVVNYSTIEGGAGGTWFDGGTGNLDIDPLFIDGSNDDFHLRVDSPCIDVGDNAAVPPAVTVDFDGNARVGDGDEDGTATVEMGVDEYTHVPVTWYVDSTLAIAGDGTSWNDAFKTMEGAIDNPLLRSADTIWVKSGRYIPPYGVGWTSGPGTYDQGAGLTIDKTIKVYGGFPAGMPNPQWADRDWKANETIIDANTQSIYERQRCFYIKGDYYSFNEMGDVIVDGFVITGGRQNGGSGVFIEHSNATISNCVITGNYGRPGAYEFGGGIKVDGATATGTIFNCVISGNWAQYGGAIAFFNVAGTEQHHQKIINCTITGNRTTGVDGYVLPVASTIIQYWAYEARLDITNTIVWNNATDPAGMEIGFVDTTIYGTYENNPGDVTVSTSDIQGGTGQPWFNAPTDLDDDPRFAQLGHWEDNGTPADARDDYWIRGDERLKVGSPCIDTGDDGSVPADMFDLDDDGDTDEPVPFDLAHGPRFLGLVNMGAYEMTAAPPSDLDGDGDVDADDLVILAPEFGVSDCVDETCTGDLDGDGDIDGADLAAFAGAL